VQSGWKRKREEKRRGEGKKTRYVNSEEKRGRRSGCWRRRGDGEDRLASAINPSSRFHKEGKKRGRQREGAREKALTMSWRG